MMEVEPQTELRNATVVLSALLAEFSAVTDYRTLRDNLPRRLAGLLQCRCVLLYQRLGETLQFASGTFDDTPGWSASLLSVAHINPIDLNSDTLEAQSWRTRHAVTAPLESSNPAFVAVPLIYRQRAIGVLVAIRGGNRPGSQLVIPNKTNQGAKHGHLTGWSGDELQIVEVVASVIAMLLENTRLLERDRERIHELSLLNSISSQMNCSMYEFERMRSIVIQRTKEISGADLCELILSSSLPNATSWITPALHELLLNYASGQREQSPSPLIIERPGDTYSGDYLNHLATTIKTFFAIPLPARGAGPRVVERGAGGRGVLVGAYHRPWKLRHEEVVLLRVLANQASAVLENMALMEDVVEARNEARKLLRQVLDDQRLKELILESIPSGLITVDMNEQITSFNRAAQAVLGYHPFEVMGQPLRNIMQIDALNDVDQHGKPQSETLVTLDRNGQELVLNITLIPLRDDRGKQIGALATFADVTTMRRLEEEKRRLDRLASLGEMAASVAHEVRNPLASIKTSVQMILDDLAQADQTAVGAQRSPAEGISIPRPLRRVEKGEVSIRCTEESEGMQESMSVVLKEVERLDAIVRDLLMFSRPRQLHLVECNITELSERVLQFIQPQCLEAGVVVHRVYHNVPLVLLDMAQMEQVLINLYLNALQAMPDGGILTVSCQIVEEPKMGMRSTVEISPAVSSHEKRPSLELGLTIGACNEQQRWLEIAVSDTGVGIPPDQLERIFQPFFTTRAHGIGLGLPITRRLIEDHHGYIRVESQLGYGATISVRLPLIDYVG